MMRCPNCGGYNVTQRIESRTTVDSKIKGFGWIKACLGYLFCSLPGVLCGLCGMGKGRSVTTTVSKNVNVCQNCGYRF